MNIRKNIGIALLVVVVLFGIHHTVFSEPIDTLATGLVGYWKFDSINSQTIADDSGNNNIGTVGTSSRLVTGRFGQALRFDAGGSQQFMTTKNTFGSGKWSVSTWINPDLPIQTANPYFGTITIVSADAINAAPAMLVITKDSIKAYQTKIADFPFETKPGWHHVAVTYNGTSLSAYVDGTLRGSIPFANTMSLSDKRYIGTNSPNSKGHIFIGSIDDFRLYNRVLDTNEISALFNNTANKVEPVVSTTPLATTTIKFAAAATPPPPPPPAKVAPTKVLATSATVTTNKAEYKLGESIQFKSDFTIDPDWITWMKGNAQTYGNFSFILRDPANTVMVRDNEKFSLVNNPQSFTYSWPIPNNPSLAGKVYSLEVVMSDMKGAGTFSKRLEDIKTEALPFAPAPASDSLELTKGLKGYWKFDTVNNGITADESGTGNSGIVRNNPPLVEGKFGKAFDLNEDTTKAQTDEQYIEMSNKFGAAQWSVSVWVKPAVPFPPYGEIPSNGTLTFLTTDPGMQSLNIQPNGVYMFYTKILDYNFKQNPGWHHIVVSYNGAELSAIVDGSIKNSIPFTKNVLANSDAVRKIGIVGTAKTQSFKGSIDEYRIYNRLLSVREIATLYNPDVVVTGELTATKSYPPETLPSWTGYTHIELNLNKMGWCKASNTPGQSYDAMAIKLNDIATEKIDYNILNTHPGDKFSYYIRCIDASGGQLASEIPVIFSIENDNAGPDIVELNASAVRDTTAEIVWSTTELANSRVEYSAQGGATKVSSDENAYGYPHAQLLTDLTPNTTYTYRAISTDKSGNTTSSPSKTFKTRGPAGRTLYVSPSGQDTNDGTIGKPFKTLEKARDAARAIRPIPAGGIQILLRAGTYERITPFVLSAADSGTIDSPIRYRAYQNEEVRITGSKEIKGFVPSTNPRIKSSGVLQVNLKDLGITDFGTRVNSGSYIRTQNSWLNLIFQDKPMVLARYPNKNTDLYKEMINIDSAPDPKQTFKILDKRPSTWSSFADIWVNGNFCFPHRFSVLKATNIVNNGNGYTITAPGDQSCVKANQPMFFSNVIEELDTPGEWYLDRDKGVLYFYPPASISSGKAYVTLANDLIDMNGVSNTIFTGIIFENARGEAIDMDSNTSNNMIENSIIRNTSAGANIAGKNNGLWGNKIYNVEDNGVVLYGGKDTTLEGGYNYADNNEIYNFGLLNKSYRAGVNLTSTDVFINNSLGLGYGVANRARYNFVHDGPHYGIISTGNNNLIDSNEVTRVIDEVVDAGAIYVIGGPTKRGTMVKYNYVHDIFGFDWSKKGPLLSVAIYHDNDTNGVSIFGNVIDNADIAILGNIGRDTEVQNNAISNIRNEGIYYNASGLNITAKNFRIPILAVSKTSPVEITTIRPHGNNFALESNPKTTVRIEGVEGATGINGEWSFKVTAPNKMQLIGTTAGAEYTGGGYMIQSEAMLDNLKKYNYDKPPYSTFYPRLSRTLLEVDDAEPRGNILERNAFYNVGKINFINKSAEKFATLDSSNILGGTAFSPTNLQALYSKGFKPIPFSQIGLIKGDSLPPVVVDPPPANPLPSTKITNNLTIKTDKSSYIAGETVKMTITFTLDPAWVTYLKAKGDTQGEMAFHATAQGSFVESTVAFNLVNTPITETYNWVIEKNSSAVGKTHTIDAQVYDANNTTKEIEVGTPVTITATPNQNIAPVAQNQSVTTVTNLDHKFTTLYTYGDSITQGASATSIARQYASIIANALGLTLVNKGVGGSVLEEDGQIDNIFAQVVNDTNLATFMTGYNNHRIQGIKASRLDTYKKALPVALAYLAIPDANKTFGSAFTKTGTWTASNTYGKTNGIVTRATGNTATVSLTGSVLYVAGTRGSVTDTGSVTVSVDGVNKGTFNCSGVELSPVDKRAYAPFMMRIPSLTNGQHTVKITSNNNGYCEINWAAGNGNIGNTKAPRVYVGGALRMTDDQYKNHSPAGTIAANKMYNDVIDETIRTLVSDGLNIVQVDNVGEFDPATMMSVDGIHPSDLGHATIASSFLKKMPGVAPITLTAIDAEKNILYTPSLPTSGTLIKLLEGMYVYKLKDKNTNGITDSFTFTAKDSTLTSTPATVTIIIPKASDTNQNPNPDPNPNPNPVDPDKDKDGVLNVNDFCDNTPQNLRTKVDKFGCPRPLTTKFDIKPANDSVKLKNILNVILGRTKVGQIQFTQPVDLVRDNAELDIDSNVIISNKKVEVRTQNVPELSKPATITLYNVTEREPKILKNGVECPPTVCVIKSFKDGVLTFTVNGF